MKREIEREGEGRQVMRDKEIKREMEREGYGGR